MTLMLAVFDVGDYDTWKQMFDSDPAGRKQSATGHRIWRSVDNPNEVFIRVEFPTDDAAGSFRDRLMASGALDRVTVKTPPTIVELADEATY